MLAAVFYTQAIGQLIAAVVAIIATASFRHSILNDASPTDCAGRCLHATDEIWRWIVGFGAVPPAFAVILRFYIPESPRYLLEVENNPLGFDAADYLRNRLRHDSVGENGGEVMQGDAFGAPGYRNTGDDDQQHQEPLEGKNHVGMEMHEIPAEPSGLNTPANLHLGTSDISPGASARSGSPVSAPSGLKVQGAPSDENRRSRSPIQISSGVYTSQNEIEHLSEGIAQTYANEGNLSAHSVSEAGSTQNFNAVEEERRRQSVHKPGKESWKEFWRGFRIFLFTDRPWTWSRFWLCLQFRDQYFFEGSWTDLAGTALAWCALDLSYYFLLINSPKIVSKVWDPQSTGYANVYPMLMQYAWRTMVSVSAGSVIGGAIFIAMAKFRYKIQLYVFLILAALLVTVGITFIKLLDSTYFAVIIVFYCFCSLFFDFGPNTSTYIIPAEVFPTRYRCTCHGISAGAGKLGSIVAQIFLAKAKFGNLSVDDPHSRWLGWALIINAFIMLFGAYVTKAWVPNPCDLNGRSRSLEDLGLGKDARRAFESQEKEERRRNDDERR